jgi:hypothetical protein
MAASGVRYGPCTARLTVLLRLQTSRMEPLKTACSSHLPMHQAPTHNKVLMAFLINSGPTLRSTTISLEMLTDYPPVANSVG